MPRFWFDPEDDTVGHKRYSALDADGTDVTIRGSSGEEVKGHLTREGEKLVLDTDQDIQQEGEVTIRFSDGEEVKGHGGRFKF